MLEKLRIKQFCCCCTTRTGSLVIGALGWMGSLLQAITLTAESSEEKIIETDAGIIIQKDTGPNTGTILMCIFMFGLSVALVIGVYKDNQKIILPWLIIKFLECCVLTIITVVIFFMLFVTLIDGLIFVFIIILLLTALYWYAWICVWSLYMDLGETTLTYVPQDQIHQMDGQFDGQYAGQFNAQINSQYVQSIPMTQPPAYPMETKPTGPPQEMV